MADPAADFKHLLDQRDQAAYFVVASVETVLRFWEVQDYERSLTLLRDALAEFNYADKEFHKLLKGEIPCRLQ